MCNETACCLTHRARERPLQWWCVVTAGSDTLILPLVFFWCAPQAWQQVSTTS